MPLFDLCRRAKERADIGLQEPPAVFFVDETECLAGDTKPRFCLFTGNATFWRLA
jgi:hypothetical protein